ncbi:acyl-CoA dehydrogenase family protein [Pseudomonas aeruginosa]|uniref:acyl-CoA dehydrogenase family protein n=1 Tax=Pseudomonas aeruginosa TaxID=287 RepID=UPI000940632B|nr:acyl-CoA dehydrogenase family protein [Pseudomonas aeruginosa]SVK35401.1 acyl-CoA dehydrogenase type 2 [Acinetobacter baumannii]EKN0249883.1 acyl-CoA dehydrogenase [Pseudomonas aeruginosa]MCO3254350.1 acyl-CoA dehydrogenase [Pseudomonas aeruginosa]MCO3934044.1 acyl-CoA dehydrogenase [Pseudomonas aeruginosa]MDG9804523.1 acyl-CoA dehydrogenase family protein [Pseudomonas aeruginosa]
MSEARLHSPDPRTPRPMAGWAASLRDSGLLALAVPRVFAGMERDWGEIFAGVRHLAEQEFELARRLALHHLQIASIRLLGSPEQQRRLLPASVERRWLWSEAVDLRRAQPEAQEHWRGGFLVGGRGSDCFAVEDVDRLLISAWHAPSRAHLIAVAETGRAGIDISGLADGSGLFLPAGQRLHYQRLRLHPEDILVPPGLPPTPCGQLREGLTRLAQANLDLGQAARVPGDVAGAPRLLALALRLVELAAESFQAAFARGGALTFRESAAASLLASEAEAVARAGLLACLRRQALEARLLGAAL